MNTGIKWCCTYRPEFVSNCYMPSNKDYYVTPQEKKNVRDHLSGDHPIKQEVESFSLPLFSCHIML